MSDNCGNVFADNEACMDACAAYPTSGDVNDGTGNTVQCRIYHAGVAGQAGQNTTHCPHASPSGAGTCVTATTTGSHSTGMPTGSPSTGMPTGSPSTGMPTGSPTGSQTTESMTTTGSESATGSEEDSSASKTVVGIVTLFLVYLSL